MAGRISKPKLIQLIHVARGALGLSDDDYRIILESAAGKTSCSVMTVRELDIVLTALKKLGFTVKRLPVKPEDVGAANYGQIEYIKGMWACCARVKTEEALNRFVKRLTGAAHIRFLTVKTAQTVIIALRDIMAKAGFDPDGIPYAEVSHAGQF